MNKKVIIKIVIISMLLASVWCTKAYCVEDTTNVRMKIDHSTAWVNINVSDAYMECEELNSTSSTLGTAALKAHLTTDYDWNAMAIFCVSQYGAITTSTPYGGSTTRNQSGIYDIGTYREFTTTLLYTSNSSSTTYLYGLYDENGNIKKYVNKINPATGEDQNGRIAIAYVQNGGTKGWMGAGYTVGTDNSLPVGLKNKSLFNIGIGAQGYGSFGKITSGCSSSDTTFRPVIWN